LEKEEAVLGYWWFRCFAGTAGAGSGVFAAGAWSAFGSIWCFGVVYVEFIEVPVCLIEGSGVLFEEFVVFIKEVKFEWFIIDYVCNLFKFERTNLHWEVGRRNI